MGYAFLTFVALCYWGGFWFALGLTLLFAAVVFILAVNTLPG